MLATLADNCKKNIQGKLYTVSASRGIAYENKNR